MIYIYMIYDNHHPNSNVGTFHTRNSSWIDGRASPGLHARTFRADHAGTDRMLQK